MSHPHPTPLSILATSPLPSPASKAIVITGISSGIGLEIVRALSTTPATLYLLARDLVKAKQALLDRGIHDPSRMHLIQADLASLDSVRAAGQAILAKTSTVNILINNAGVMALPAREETVDKVEVQFGVNYLAHFVLFQVLKGALVKASSDGFRSRVVNVAASGHRLNGLNPNSDYRFANEQYDPWKAYAQSKTALVYMANEIERRFQGHGVHATSVHPGLVDTDIGRYLPQEHVQAMMRSEKVMSLLKTPEQGAATIIWAAVGREWEGRGGRYLVDCREAEWGPDDGDRLSSAYAPHTYCPEQEGRLWRDSLRMVGLGDD